MKDVFNLGITQISPIFIIDKLTTLKTKKSRMNILRQAWDSDSESFFIGLQISMDNDVDFMCDKVPAWSDDDCEETLSFEEFYIFYLAVKNMKYTKEEIDNKILELANKAGSKEWNIFYRKILLKKLQDILPMEEIIQFLKTIEDETKIDRSDTSVLLKRK